jgi:rhodanese-related sulfurtransferase
VVFPAHGAGSLCGANLGDSPSSTIGAEKASNPYLRHKSRGAFIAALLEDLPEAPQYFKHDAAMNKKGPDLVDWKAPLPRELAADMALADASRYCVVDLRNAAEYAAGHIPNSGNIALRGRLETWVGIMVPWDMNLILCGSTEELKEATYRLHRVGYHAECITMDSWKKSGLRLARNERMDGDADRDRPQPSAEPSGGALFPPRSLAAGRGRVQFRLSFEHGGRGPGAARFQGRAEPGRRD